MSQGFRAFAKVVSALAFFFLCASGLCTGGSFLWGLYLWATKQSDYSSTGWALLGLPFIAVSYGIWRALRDVANPK